MFAPWVPSGRYSAPVAGFAGSRRPFPRSTTVAVVPDLDLVAAVAFDSPSLGGLDLFYHGILPALEP